MAKNGYLCVGLGWQVVDKAVAIRLIPREDHQQSHHVHLVLQVVAMQVVGHE